MVHNHLIFVEVKEMVLTSSIKTFTQGGDRVLEYQHMLCFPNVNDL